MTGREETAVVAFGRRPNNQQVNKAGRHYVSAELHRRGAHDVVVGEARGEPDVCAANEARTRRVEIIIRAKTAGDWQPSTDSGVPHKPESEPVRFWVLVDLRQTAPQYYVMPAWWIENNIYEVHQAYLRRHGGHRARSPESKHHRITDDRVEQWRDRWDLLAVFD